MQALAGQNPLSIRAVTDADLKQTTVTDEHVKYLLEGKTLQESMQKSKLWVLDYYEVYKGFQDRIHALKTPSLLYAGRCFFYTK